MTMHKLILSMALIAFLIAMLASVRRICAATAAMPAIQRRRRVIGGAILCMSGLVVTISSVLSNQPAWSAIFQGVMGALMLAGGIWEIVHHMRSKIAG